MSTLSNITMASLAKIHQMWQCSHHCDIYSSLQPEDSGGTICEAVSIQYTGSSRKGEAYNYN